MVLVDLIILLLVIAGIADIYERVARAIKAHRQLKESSSKDSSSKSNSAELDALKERLQLLEEKLQAHKHAPRRRTAGE
jgi:hypothetical protein